MPSPCWSSHSPTRPSPRPRTHCHRGTTAPPNRPSWHLSRRSPTSPIPSMSRPRIASPPSTRTGRSGSSTRWDLLKILAATLTGMSVDEFNAEAKKWLATAKDPRWDRLYTELTYQPMLEVMQYLRDNGFKTYIVTGGGQDFVRVYSERVYGIPPEQVVGTAGGTKYGYDKEGKPFLTKEPKLLLNDDNAGKPEGIHLMIGSRPYAAFGNSTGDQQMLEYTKAGDGARLAMLVLHDDAKREYAYGPAQGLPDTKVGTFTQELYDEAMKDGWIVISMKNDCRFQLNRRPSHFRVRFFQLNRRLTRLFQPNRRPFALSSAKSHTRSENREFSGQQPEETVRPAIPLPTRPSQHRARNDDFSFKSATKLRPQMVYELNEKSTI